LRGFSAEQLAQLPYCWELWARPEQLPPAGDWRCWLYLAGRGAGKTRSAAEAIRAAVESGERRQIGIVAPTTESLRRVCVEGPSGILAVHPPAERPTYEMSLGRLTWCNGAQAQLFSAEEPERLRGPNLSLLWIDEICSFADPQRVWDLAMMALRLPGATKPAQCIVTTTPKPSTWLRGLMAAPDTTVTRGSTMANAANLDAHTVEYLQRRYAGTSLGRQELQGELLMDSRGCTLDPRVN
jgi:phage terminase large subunit-like protein